MQDTIISKNNDLIDIYADNLIVAYSGDIPIGFVMYKEGVWKIQKSSDFYSICSDPYNNLSELFENLSKLHKDFNLKVL